MRNLLISAAALALIIGCNPKTEVVGPNGERVSVEGNGGKMTITGPDGKQATIEGDGKTIKMDDGKGGTMSMGGTEISEAELGLPYYPGSTDTPGSAKVTADGKTTLVCLRETTDDPSKVIAFYKDKIKDGKDANMSSGNTVMGTLSGKTDAGGEVNIVANKEGSEKTKISISIQRTGS